MPLHNYRVVGTGIRFPHGNQEFYPFTDELHPEVNDRDYFVQKDISKHDDRKHGYRSFHHSIENPDCSGAVVRDQLTHETHHWR